LAINPSAVSWYGLNSWWSQGSLFSPHAHKEALICAHIIFEFQTWIAVKIQYPSWKNFRLPVPVS
jgi:hypothetical protein